MKCLRWWHAVAYTGGAVRLVEGNQADAEFRRVCTEFHGEDSYWRCAPVTNCRISGPREALITSLGETLRKLGETLCPLDYFATRHSGVCAIPCRITRDPSGIGTGRCDPRSTNTWTK